MISSTPNNVQKLRIGIMCNSLLFKQWQVKSINLLINAGLVEIVLLIQKENSVEKKNGFIDKFFPLKTLVFRVWCKFFFHPKSIENIDLTEFFKHTKYIKCKTTFKGKYSEYFCKNDVEQIKNNRLDIILRFGFNIIRGDILNSAKYGVWSFHHDDELKYRGGPAGFWEIIKNDPVNGVILQRLTDTLDAGVILRKSYFKTINHSFSANVDQLFFGAAGMPLQCCRDILHSADYYFGIENINLKAPIYKVPGIFRMKEFIFILLINKIKFHYNQLFKAEKWNVGFVEIKSDLLLNFPLPEKVEWLPKPNIESFFADSFAIEKKNGELEMFFEDYSYKTEKGIISSVNYSKNCKDKFSKKSVILEKPYHLAYPYIYLHADEQYMIPESSKSTKIILYKKNKVTGKFELYKTLLESIDAVDTTLFFYKNKWWLFFTRKVADTNTCLFAYFSETFDGTYKEHTNNPIKIDVRQSRPAGTPFFINGTLIRPTQDNSEYYGKQIYLNKILKLNENEFEEEIINVLKPNKEWLYNSGLHTICVTENYVVFDAKKYEFIWSAFTKSLSRKIKRLQN